MNGEWLRVPSAQPNYSLFIIHYSFTPSFSRMSRKLRLR